MATEQELQEELAEVRARLDEAEETLRAIRQGEVDALVVSGPEGDQIFTLKGADHTFRVLVETINEGAATLTGDGTIIYANRKLADLLKIPLQKLIGSAIGEYIPPPERHLFEALLSQGQRAASHGELSLEAAGGALVPAYISLNSMRLESVPGMVCLAVTDLSHQKRDEALVAEGKLSQEILSQAEQAIAVCDESGRIIRASHGLHQLCEQNPLFLPFQQAIPLCFDTHEPFSLEPLYLGKTLHNQEMYLRRQDGAEVAVLVNAGPLLDDRRQLRGCVVAFTDITERKRAEAALKASEQRLRRFYESDLLGVIYWNVDGEITEANDKFLEMAGYQREDLTAGRINWRKMTPPEYLHRNEAAIKELQPTGTHETPFEKEYLRPDGTRLPIITAGAVVDEASGNGVSFILDISDRKRAEAALKRAHDNLEQQVAERTADLRQTVEHLEEEITERQQMEEALLRSEERLRNLATQLLEVQEQERRRLSMDLHDDLGQSLLVLKMRLSALLRRSSPEPPIRLGLEQACGYIVDIINKVRSISHALSPKALENLGLMRAMDALLEEFQQYHEIAVKADLDEMDQLLSKADHIRVYRILQEFLANVHKHAEATQVTVIMKALPGKITISMQDNGKGFNLEDIKGRPREGRGLGVASMEERLRMMGSQFRLTSQPGQGTQLYFEIPRPPEQEL